MALVLNVVALVLVVMLAWAGTMWLARKAHRGDPMEQFEEEFPGWEMPAQEPCPECRGSGASRREGRLEPCGRCSGTGLS